MSAAGSMRTPELRRAVAWMVVAGAMWTGVEALGAMLPRAVSPVQTVWARYAVQLALLVLIVVPTRGWTLVRTRRPLQQVVRAQLMILMPACFIAGAVLAGVGNTWGGFWVFPLITTALARVCLGERVPSHRWVALCIGLTGVWLILTPPGPVLRWAMLPAVGMALAFSGYQVWTRAMSDEATEADLFYTAAFVLLPLSVLLPWVWHMPSLQVIAVWVGIGAIGLVGLLALDRALHLAPASVVSQFFGIQAVWLLLLEWAISERALDRKQVAGGALALGAAVFAMYREGQS